jgi:tetratricopeptide (TPR) repeat protein
VNNKAGAPIKGAKVVMERTEITWTKTLTTNDKGVALQVGLEPKDFRVTISADGYGTLHSTEKVPVGEVLARTFVLLTPDETRAAAKTEGMPADVDPNMAKQAEGSDAYNQGIHFYNEQNFTAALPHLEIAYKNLAEAAANMKDATAKADLESKLPNIERVYAISMAEAAKGDDTKVDQAKQAEPMLVKALERNPKDSSVVTALLDVAAAKKDAEMTKKYQAMMDAIIGPRPELAYNDAVVKHNAGDEAGAKLFLDKAIAMDPKFSDSYYLLGVVQFSLTHVKEAKEAFRKYLEIDPKGKKSAEVKEFLKELGK